MLDPRDVRLEQALRSYYEGPQDANANEQYGEALRTYYEMQPQEEPQAPLMPTPATVPQAYIPPEEFPDFTSAGMRAPRLDISAEAESEVYNPPPPDPGVRQPTDAGPPPYQPLGMGPAEPGKNAYYRARGDSLPIQGTSGFARNPDGSFMTSAQIAMGADPDAIFRQQTEQLTQSMPMTQADRTRMQAIGFQISRINQAPNLTDQSRLQAIAPLRAEYDMLRQRQQQEENQEIQRTRTLAQAQAFDQAGMAAQAEEFYWRAYNVGRRTPSGALEHTDTEGNVIGHSVPGKGGRAEFVQRQAGGEERQSANQQRLRIADERQMLQVETQVDRDMDRREDNYRSAMRAWEDRVASIRRDAHERQVTITDADLPPPPRAEAWVHDPDRRDAERHRRMARSLGLLGRRLPDNVQAPSEPVVGPQQPSGAAPAQGQATPTVQRAAPNIATAIFGNYERRISQLPNAHRSVVSPLLARARTLWEQHGASMPPDVAREYGDLSRQLDAILAGAAPTYLRGMGYEAIGGR